MLYHSVHHETE